MLASMSIWRVSSRQSGDSEGARDAMRSAVDGRRHDSVIPTALTGHPCPRGPRPSEDAAAVGASWMALESELGTCRRASGPTSRCHRTATCALCEQRYATCSALGSGI